MYREIYFAENVKKCFKSKASMLLIVSIVCLIVSLVIFTTGFSERVGWFSLIIRGAGLMMIALSGQLFYRMVNGLKKIKQNIPFIKFNEKELIIRENIGSVAMKVTWENIVNIKTFEDKLIFKTNKSTNHSYNANKFFEQEEYSLTNLSDKETDKLCQLLLNR